MKLDYRYQRRKLLAIRVSDKPTGNSSYLPNRKTYSFVFSTFVGLFPPNVILLSLGTPDNVEDVKKTAIRKNTKSFSPWFFPRPEEERRFGSE